ncbi:MAG TPA: sigma-70 family RNA polymerase sigma factor [Acidobacteriaceae bacterium]|nr:sigma-70 family RNA polymerase sigma factor [Acidobacteriaceae bacterium]
MEMSAAPTSDSQEEVTRPSQEDIQELSTIVTHRLHYFRRIAMRHLGNVHDAEDAVQDALLSASKHLGQFRGQAQMTTWLTTIVINSTRTKARSRLQEAHISIDAYNDDHEHYPLADKLSDGRPDPEALFRERELKDKVERLSQQLSPVLRETFRLRTFDELSTRETAAALGVRMAAVKTRASRARVHLKRMLQKGYGGQPSFGIRIGTAVGKST